MATRSVDDVIRLVVLLSHAAHERERAVARHDAGIEVVRPSDGDPGSLHRLVEGLGGALILDFRLPEVSGAEIASDLREQFPGLSIVVLSGYDHIGLLRALGDLGPRAASGAGVAEAAVVGAASLAVDRRCLLSAETVLRSQRLLEPLTRREYEVLRFVAAGRHNREIAEELGVSLKTVEFHAGHVYQKLGVRSRVEAIIEARRLQSVLSRDSA